MKRLELVTPDRLLNMQERCFKGAKSGEFHGRRKIVESCAYGSSCRKETPTLYELSLLGYAA